MRDIMSLGIILGLTGIASAQPNGSWGPDPRAYRHFLTSPYSYRTYSSSTPGAVGGVVTPFSMSNAYVEPSYLHQRITPWGFEHSRRIPGYGGYAVDPFSSRGYRVPAGWESSFTPWR